MKQLLLTTIAAVVLVGCGNPEADRALLDASEKENIEAVKQHIAAGTDVDAKDEDGYTSLHKASSKGHKEIVELLIAKGADVNAKSERGRTPLANAARWGHKEIIELLIAKGANVNAKDEDGDTPLDWAIEDNHTEVPDLLRKHGGKTGEELGAEESIHIAARVGHIEAVKKHLTGGVDVNAKQQGSGDTALHNAAKGGHKETVELLIAKGANENAKDKYGWTPLHSPASNGHKEIVELLIDNGADLDAKNIRGVTPLHEAASNGQEEVVELLIAEGADLNAKTGNSKTPLDWAIRFDETETADLLHKHGGKTAEANAVEPVAEAAKPEPPKFLTDILSEKPASKPPTYVTIHDAARRGNIGFVKYYLAKGIDINIQGNFKEYTPLHEAIAGRQLEVVKLLIDEGANVNAKDSMGWTPLDNATGVLNKPKIADLLRKHGGKTAEANAVEPVAEAAKPEPPKFLTDILSEKPASKPPTYVTIHDAARRGNIGFVKYYLAKGIDINIQGNFKEYTPLHEAIAGRQLEVVKLLIDEGANVNAKDSMGWTPLDNATGVLNKPKIADLLRKHGGKTKKELEAAELGVSVERLPRISIHDAAGASGRKGNIEAVKQHLAAGTDVDARDRQDKTPLQHAAYWGHKEIAEELIAKGADVNAKDNAGTTTLDWAILGGKKESVELLIVNGVDVNAKSENGFTPLDLASLNKRTEPADLLRKNGGKHGTIHGAAAGGDTKAVKEFLSAGTEVTARDKYGSATPLHFAASGGNKEIAELLIAKGADVNAKDEDGWTPLHLAAEEGHKEIAELLIDKGADVNAKDNDGWIPLHYAALDGHKEVVELLIAEGAVVNAKMEDGDTALDMADGEIADLLRKHGGKTSEELKAEGN